MRISTLCAAILSLACASAHAAPITFFGEDINRTASGPGMEDARRIFHPLADAARNGFMQKLHNVKTENFESFASNTMINTLQFGDTSATLSKPLQVKNVVNGTFNGTYPISGNQFLLQAVGASEQFRINFSAPQVAFGFYMTDIEVPGNFSLRFHGVDGRNVDYAVPTRANAGGANNTGSVAYFGMIDKDAPFSGVTFVRNQNRNDGFGFDDMTIGNLSQVSNVPEAESWAMMGLGLLALGAFARKRKQAA
ncbi:PEP-CTERM sorting domain-containing protein [Massilia sp. W12]|uniref:PEP-CTERM sorting domain-containing protein n=1 Tax=Massilia sp. W12 TaxID=3126507 RepID=UPI0030CF687A